MSTLFQPDLSLTDAAALAPRTPPADVLAPFRQDPAFHYREAPAPESLLGQLWRSFREFIGRAFDSPFGPALEWVFYVALALVVVWALLKLVRMEPSGAFRRPATARLAFDDEVGRVEEMDFERLVEEALVRKDLRRAVRLLYLRTLRDLGRRGLVALQPEKTNRQYERELTRTLRPAFSRLTSLYEYVWYGHFEVGEDTFTAARADFDWFAANLEGERAQG